MTSYDDALDDLDAALARAKEARWAEDYLTEQRRSFNEVMGCIYRLRNHLCEADRGAYWRSVDQCRGGRVVEAIVLVRGATDHDFSRDVAPRTGYAYPSERLFPSPNLYLDDRNLFWRRREDLDHDLSARDSHRRVADYDEHLADFLVLDTLEDARAFFAAYHSQPTS